MSNYRVPGYSHRSKIVRGEVPGGQFGTPVRTRYATIPCPCCREDTTHYVGKCIHCKKVNIVIPDIKPKKFLYGRGEAA